jgi:hypothetical protein
LYRASRPLLPLVKRVSRLRGAEKVLEHWVCLFFRKFNKRLEACSEESSPVLISVPRWQNSEPAGTDQRLLFVPWLRGRSKPRAVRVTSSLKKSFRKLWGRGWWGWEGWAASRRLGRVAKGQEWLPLLTYKPGHPL